MKPHAPALLLVLACASRVEASGSLNFRLGTLAPHAESDVWATNFTTLNLDAGRFNFFAGGVELTVHLNPRLALAFGVDGYNRSVDATYRDFIRDDGSPIVQQTQLTLIPVTAGARFLLAGVSHRFIPYVAGGAGAYYFDYQQQGDFVNSTNFKISPGAFRDRGLVLGGYVAFGLEFALTNVEDGEEGFSVFGEFRRHWAETDLDTTLGSSRLDLGARQLSAGVALRF